jgi:nitronate monooxygenase
MARLQTPLCDLLAIDVPIVQAPIGSASCPELVSAVSNAGGLGMFAMSWRDADTIRAMIRDTRALTSRPFGVNLVLEWDQVERLEVCLGQGVRIVSFSWGDPAPYVPVAHRAGAIVLHTVGSAEEARQAVAAGVDVIVAQGWEAGGHVRGEVSTIALVPAVVDAVSPIPVIAAGGISDGRGIAAALALGAQGVWIGTRFLATSEAPLHAEYRRRLVEATEAGTVHTELFDEGWPNAPHRVLRNAAYDDWIHAGQPPAGARPGEGETIGAYEDGEQIPRYTQNLPGRGVQGEVDQMPMYAGQGVGLVRDVQPAAQVLERLVQETEQALRQISELA